MKLRFDYNNMMSDVLGEHGIDASAIDTNADKSSAAFRTVLANCGTGWPEWG